MIDKTRVVTVARSWIGTPFHHLARVRGAGVDCIGLVIGVARELALVPADFDVQGYAETPDGRTLMRLAAMHMTEIGRDAMAPGLHDAVVQARLLRWVVRQKRSFVARFVRWMERQRLVVAEIDEAAVDVFLACLDGRATNAGARIENKVAAADADHGALIPVVHRWVPA